MPAELARKAWPSFVWSQFGFAVQSIIHMRESAARARLRGQLVAIRDLPHFIAKRQYRSTLHLPGQLSLDGWLS
jgi:hypothetical protein